MKELTIQEALQAIIDGKKVEIRGVNASQNDDWKPLDERETHIRVLTNGLFMFRLAQEMITVGGISFPAPEGEPLEPGTRYWITRLGYMHYIPNAITWAGDSYDRTCLKRGLIHLSKENAVAHAEALTKLSGGSVND